jgi:nucleotide-binding universal stress UspA family protein
MTVAASGSLRVMHVRDTPEHTPLPSVRSTLTRWGLLPEDAAVDDVATLGVVVSKVETHPGDPVQAIVRDVERHAPDLLVLATHGREGLARLFAPNVAEPAARRAHVPTLFLSPHARGFVADDGSIHLARVLLPVDAAAWPSLGAEAAARLTRIAGDSPVVFRILHVGVAAEHPVMHAYARESWRWERATRAGAVVAGILAEAAEWQADAIVMPSAGHDSPGDVVFGSHAEQVAREAPCPVLVVPGN